MKLLFHLLFCKSRNNIRGWQGMTGRGMIGRRMLKAKDETLKNKCLRRWLARGPAVEHKTKWWDWEGNQSSCDQTLFLLFFCFRQNKTGYLTCTSLLKNKAFHEFCALSCKVLELRSDEIGHIVVLFQFDSWISKKVFWPSEVGFPDQPRLVRLIRLAGWKSRDWRATTRRDIGRSINSPIINE